MTKPNEDTIEELRAELDLVKRERNAAHTAFTSLWHALHDTLNLPGDPSVSYLDDEECLRTAVDAITELKRCRCSPPAVPPIADEPQESSHVRSS